MREQDPPVMSRRTWTRVFTLLPRLGCLQEACQIVCRTIPVLGGGLTGQDDNSGLQRGRGGAVKRKTGLITWVVDHH